MRKLNPTLSQELMTMVALKEAAFGPRGNLRFLGIKDLILKRGRRYRLAPLPKGHRLPCTLKGCFGNVYAATARRRSPWIYVEGLARHRDVPFAVHHAWLTRADRPGIAFDPTWQGRFDLEGAEYRGIPIKREYVKEMYQRSKCQYMSVFDTWWEGFSIYTGKDRIEDVLWKEAN